jgi:hypothetical protein
MGGGASDYKFGGLWTWCQQSDLGSKAQVPAKTRTRKSLPLSSSRALSLLQDMTSKLSWEVCPLSLPRPSPLPLPLPPPSFSGEFAVACFKASLADTMLLFRSVVQGCAVLESKFFALSAL